MIRLSSISAVVASRPAIVSLFPFPSSFGSECAMASGYTSLVFKLTKTLTPMTADVKANRFRTAQAVSSSEREYEELGMERLVHHLVVEAKDFSLLLELEKRILQGEDLSDLAAEYSICPSKKIGGMIGWVRKGQLVSEFDEAVFNNPLHKVVRCKTKAGWHLLQVLSEREGRLLKNIKPEELHSKLKDPEFIGHAQLIDVRESKEVAKACLPGFEVLPLSQFGTWGPDLPSKLDPLKETYVLCQYGLRSLQIGKWLREQGFKKVFIVKGGIHAYAVSVDPSIPTY